MANVEPWRPYNETAEDLANERAVADILEDKWGIRFLKLSEQLYGVDWVICAGKRIHGFAEFKCRRNDYYDELLLSAGKFWKLEYLSLHASLPCYVIVEWKTGIYVADVSSFSGLTVRLGGNGRGQKGDIEPCVFLPMAQFEKVQ